MIDYRGNVSEAVQTAAVQPPLLAQGYDYYRTSPWVVAALSLFFFTETIIPRELHFGIALALLAAASLTRLSILRPALASTLPLALIAIWSAFLTVAVGSIVGFDSGNIAKGVFYASSAIVYTALGYACFHLTRTPSTIFKAICATALVIAIGYIIKYYSDPQIATALAAGNRTYLRHTLGAGTNLWAPAIALSIAAPSLITNKAWIPRVAILPFTAFALFISTGRTGLAWVFILVAMLALRRTRSVFIYCAIATVVYLFFVTVLTPILPMYFGDWSLQWVEHLPSFEESVPVNQSDLPGVNMHWRGYETFIAFQYVSMFPHPWNALGTGLSSVVPIGFNFELGGEERQYLPIFHNGLSFIMVRAGFVGIGLYLWQNIRWIKNFRSMTNDNMLAKANLFGIGLVLCLLFSLPTITGLYQQGDCKSIFPFIVGYLIAYNKITTRTELGSPSAF